MTPGHESVSQLSAGRWSRGAVGITYDATASARDAGRSLADGRPQGRYPHRVTTEEPPTPDRGELGLPPAGVKLDREQSLRWLAARDAGREPVPGHVHEWARRVLRLPPARRTA